MKFFKLSNNDTFFNNFSSHKIFNFNENNLTTNKLFNNQEKFTIKYHLLTLNSINSKSSFNKFKLNIKYAISPIFINFNKKYNKFNSKLLFNNYDDGIKTFKSNNLWTLFDIIFLKKEKIYTKLKYSRVPQYDIVSGGAAALFAGFLGFLISEKFGWELVDSGDFYFLFMYLVFLFFSLRLFLKIINFDNFSWNILSLKWLINFYQILIILVIRKIKNFFK